MFFSCLDKLILGDLVIYYLIYVREEEILFLTLRFFFNKKHLKKKNLLCWILNFLKLTCHHKIVFRSVEFNQFICVCVSSTKVLKNVLNSIRLIFHWPHNFFPNWLMVFCSTKYQNIYIYIYILSNQTKYFLTLTYNIKNFHSFFFFT